MKRDYGEPGETCGDRRPADPRDIRIRLAHPHVTALWSGSFCEYHMQLSASTQLRDTRVYGLIYDEIRQLGRCRQWKEPIRLRGLRLW